MKTAIHFAGITTLERAAAIATCRASGCGDAALEYRRVKGLPLDGIAMGVLVQQMVRPVAAGVGFTANPITGSRDELVINAWWGRGEALVSGQVDPDEFIVRKGDGELLCSRLGDKGRSGAAPEASLTPPQLAEVVRVLLEIERHYGAPQDVEWCHDGATLWIVQSRPITTTVPGSRETEWTRAFHGRLHFNLDHLRYTCTLSGVPAAVMLRSMGYTGTIRPEDEQLPKPSLATLARAGDFACVSTKSTRCSGGVRHQPVCA